VLTKKLLAEFIGTCFLVMVVVGSGIMAENLTSNEFNILLANTIVTGAGLTALIWIFISISGAHFNPAVSLVMFLNKELKFDHLVYFIIFQCLGGFFGTVLANLMFNLDPISISSNVRSGSNIYLSEFIATFGLILTILGSRRLSNNIVAPAVGLYITAGYWFTSSTSFANPSVTFARGFTDTFTGISPEYILPFICFQIIGAITALVLLNYMHKD
jgi:glycerol uptake facilitator-like aquaporin